MEWLKTAIPFVSGALVGGGAAYLALPAVDDASSVPPGEQPHAEAGQAPPTGTDGPSGAQAPVPFAGQPGQLPPTPPPSPVPVSKAGPAQPPPVAASPGQETPAAPRTTPQAPGGRLEKHIRNAPTIWANLLTAARSDPRAASLVPEVEAHIASLPVAGETMPPMQDVAAYLATSKLLLDRMTAAGMDVSVVSLQIDMLLRPPRGNIPGGPRGSSDSPG